MKKTSFTLLVLTLMAHNTVLARECKEVTATAHPDYPPYHWKDGKHIIGASVDLNAKIFAELGIPFKVQYLGPWKRVLNRAELGKVDMVLGLKKTTERENYLTFSTSPIFPNPFTIFTLKDKQFKFNSWEDLKHHYGGKNAGDRYGDPFDTFANTHLSIEDAYSTQSNLSKLQAGRIEYVIHGRYVGRAHFTNLPGGDQVVALELNINEGFIHSAFTKGSPCTKFLPYISKRYREMLESGEAEQFLDQNQNRWHNHTKEKHKGS